MASLIYFNSKKKNFFPIFISNGVYRVTRPPLRCVSRWGLYAKVIAEVPLMWVEGGHQTDDQQDIPVLGIH